MREPTRSEKLVFGEHCEIDPETDLPIESGIGAVTSRDLVAKRQAEAEHRAEHERLQAAEKSLTAERDEAHQKIADITAERDEALKRAEAAEAAAMTKPAEGVH